MKNLPPPLRQFVPLFVDLLPHIGTKNFEYTTFQTLLHQSTGGLEVQLDKFSPSKSLDEHSTNLILSVAFLDQNISKAMALVSELVATPNFDNMSNLTEVIKMNSVEKANEIGNKSLEYGFSYSQA